MSSRISTQKNVPLNKNVEHKDALCCVQFSFDSCLLAAKNNHIACLIRARTAGCPLGENVVKMAKQLQHEDCWTYAKSNVNTIL